MLRWLVLDLNSFFASCEQQEDPALRGKPIIVVPAMVETTCAIAASYPVKAFGIKTGTLVHEARRLCPNVQLVQAHHKLYVEYHHRILTAIDKHIPVEEVMSIDEVACRLDRVQQDPAVAQKLAHAIKREIQTQVGECLTSSIAISANKLLAKMASNMQKPDGLTILPIEKLPGAILDLKIRAIPGIGPKMAEHLQRNGITDIATLWNTDAARLRLIWGGVAGAKMHELLHGADIASPKTERASISHQHVLAPEDRSIEGAAPIVRQLLVRAAQRLRDDGFYCRRLIVEVKPLGRDRDSWTDKRRFSETQDTGLLLHVLQDIWQQVPDLKPLRVGVALTGLAAREKHQPDLFDKPKNAKLVRAIDEVNEKFGKGALIYGDAAPDQTSRSPSRGCRRRRSFEDKARFASPPRADVHLHCPDPAKGSRHCLHKRCPRLMADSGEQPSIIEPNWFTPQRLHLEQLTHGLIERGDDRSWVRSDAGSALTYITTVQ